MNKFEKTILRCIKEAEKELDRRKKGQPGDGTEEEINDVIIPELNELLLLCKNKQFPEQKSRYLNSFACAFTVWCWNIRTPSKLFSLLGKVDDMYKNVK